MTATVLLMEMPPMLRQILERVIAQRGDLRLIRDDDGVRSGLHRAEPPDAVICRARPSDDARRASALLDRWPRSKVLVLTTSGHASLHELAPHRTDLGPVSPDEALQAIHDSLASESGWHS